MKKEKKEEREVRELVQGETREEGGEHGGK